LLCVPQGESEHADQGGDACAEIPAAKERRSTALIAAEAYGLICRPKAAARAIA